MLTSIIEELWYEEHWNGAEDVTSEILRTIERHTDTVTAANINTAAAQSKTTAVTIS